MTQYRRLDREETIRFFKACNRKYSNVSGNFIRVREVLGKGMVSRLANFAAFKAVLHPHIPYPLKDLLCAALRERILVDDQGNKELAQLCIRDKLRSRRDEGLSTSTVFSAEVVFFGRIFDASKLPEDLKETIYDDSV